MKSRKIIDFVNLSNNHLWKKIIKDFPHDPALQEVHYARLKIYE